MRTSFVVLYVGDINLNQIALVKLVDTDLLNLGQHCGALAYPYGGNARLHVDTLNGGGDDLAQLALKLDKALSLLAGADTLTDNVSRRGNGDPAQTLRIERNFYLVAYRKFLSLVDLAGLLKGDLKVGILNLIYDGLYKLNVE